MLGCDGVAEVGSGGRSDATPGSGEARRELSGPGREPLVVPALREGPQPGNERSRFRCGPSGTFCRLPPMAAGWTLNLQASLQL